MSTLERWGKRMGKGCGEGEGTEWEQEGKRGTRVRAKKLRNRDLDEFYEHIFLWNMKE